MAKTKQLGDIKTKSEFALWLAEAVKKRGLLAPLPTKVKYLLNSGWFWDEKRQMWVRYRQGGLSDAAKD
jgi:hypothetical protein